MAESDIQRIKDMFFAAGLERKSISMQELPPNIRADVQALIEAGRFTPEGIGGFFDGMPNPQRREQSACLAGMLLSFTQCHIWAAAIAQYSGFRPDALKFHEGKYRNEIFDLFAEDRKDPSLNEDGEP